MDTLALASVVTSGVVGLGGLATAVWSSRKAGNVAREGQVRERRIDAYLDVLRLIEHGSLWYQAVLRRSRLAGDEFENPPKLPREPEVGERATIDALLAAFGSPALTASCERWLDAADEMNRLLEVAAWNYTENYSGPSTPTNAEDLRNLEAQALVLQAERREIERTVAREINSERA